MKDSVRGRAYPGHGAIINVASAKIGDYINHRQQRENEVLRVLKFGKLDVDATATAEASPERVSSWTPIQLVKVIYKDVPESLHLPASNGVIQVLNKLEAEGKVKHDRDSGEWQLIAQRPVL
jgi:endoribonuclease LACTB2